MKASLDVCGTVDNKAKLLSVYICCWFEPVLYWMTGLGTFCWVCLARRIKKIFAITVFVDSLSWHPV